jgi:hypothetical protein
MRRIGAMMLLAEDDPVQKSRTEAFLQGLQQSGWTDRRNVQIDYRWGAGDSVRARRYAPELVALAPDVILAPGSASLGPLLQVTRDIPIVFVHVFDPVGAGFVDSLAKPGGNATGFLWLEDGISVKWLALLKEVAPDVTRVAVIRDPAITSGIGQFGAIQAVAPSIGLEVRPVNVRDASEIERAPASVTFLTSRARGGAGVRTRGHDGPLMLSSIRADSATPASVTCLTSRARGVHTSVRPGRVRAHEGSPRPFDAEQHSGRQRYSPLTATSSF